MNTIETLTEVFALASGAVDLADKLIEVTKGKGRKVDGYYAKIGSSGYYAQIDSTGEKAVVSAIGSRAVAKAKVGSWITLAEYKIDENKRWVVDFVKTEYVDGEKIKGDTFYCLYKHEFRKYVDYDKIPAAVLNYRKGVYKVVTFDDFVRGEITYIVEKDGVYSHGKTIKEAREIAKCYWKQ